MRKLRSLTVGRVWQAMGLDAIKDYEYRFEIIGEILIDGDKHFVGMKHDFDFHDGGAMAGLAIFDEWGKSLPHVDIKYALFQPSRARPIFAVSGDISGDAESK